MFVCFLTLQWMVPFFSDWPKHSWWHLFLLCLLYVQTNHGFIWRLDCWFFDHGISWIWFQFGVKKAGFAATDPLRCVQWSAAYYLDIPFVVWNVPKPYQLYMHITVSLECLRDVHISSGKHIFLVIHFFTEILFPCFLMFCNFLQDQASSISRSGSFYSFRHSAKLWWIVSLCHKEHPLWWSIPNHWKMS